MAEAATDLQLLRIKPFKGTEFNSWESNLKLILEQHSVLDVISDSPPDPTTDPAGAAQFAQNDIKARFIITQAVADQMQIFIKDQKTAKGMLESLQRDFGPFENAETTTIHHWSDEETKRLLSFYSQLLPELAAGRIATKEKMMAVIEKKMNSKVTAAQCANRIKSLQRTHRQHKNGQGGRSLIVKYADMLDAIEKGTYDPSTVWLDNDEEPESMDVDCESDPLKAANQIYESTTVIPHAWSDDDTNRLLDLYKQLKPELVVGSISSQEKAMEIIAEEIGGHVTPSQCLNRFKNLRAAYKNYKKDPGAKKFKYAEAMKAIDGEDPDQSTPDEANEDSHDHEKIVIVANPTDILSDDSNDGETTAAVETTAADAVTSQDDAFDEEEDEQRSYMVWSRANTIKLLGLYENFACQVGSPQIKSRARMWVLISRRMGKLFTPEQCASKWKTLERSYKRAVCQGRGNSHPFSAQMKSVQKRLRQASRPMGSKLSTKPTSSSDITFFLEKFDNSVDGDGTVDQGETSSPRVTGIYSLLPNQVDEQEGDALWSHESTLKLIELYKQLKSHVGSSKIRTHKKMWQVIAENMGGNLNANQCENRWRVLERKYRRHLSYPSSLSLRGKSKKTFEYFSQMDAILNWSSKTTTDYLDLSCPDPNGETTGVQLSSSTICKPPIDIIATSSFQSAQKRLSEYFEEDLDENKEKTPCKLRILERMRKDKKEYYNQMVNIHRERLEVEKQRLEELKRKNRILERSLLSPNKT